MRRRIDWSEVLVYTFIFLIGFVMLIGLYLDKQSTPRVVDYMDVEYHLEIINQDSVKVRNADTGRVYVTHMDSIQAVLEQDNL